MGVFDGTILASLTAAQREALERRCLHLDFRAQRTVIFRGEILHDVFLLCAGTVEARYRLRGAAASLALTAGDFFGERALTDDAVSDCEVRSVSAASVLAAPSDALRPLLEANADFARCFFERVESRRIALWSASGVLRAMPSLN